MVALYNSSLFRQLKLEIEDSISTLLLKLSLSTRNNENFVKRRYDENTPQGDETLSNNRGRRKSGPSQRAGGESKGRSKRKSSQLKPLTTDSR